MPLEIPAIMKLAEQAGRIKPVGPGSPGCYYIDPPLAVICTKNEIEGIEKGKVVHINIVDLDNPPDQIHIKENGGWFFQEDFELAE